MHHHPPSFFLGTVCKRQQALLRGRRLSDLQSDALEAELDRLFKVIEAIDPALPGTTSG